MFIIIEFCRSFQSQSRSLNAHSHIRCETKVINTKNESENKFHWFLIIVRKRLIQKEWIVNFVREIDDHLSPRCALANQIKINNVVNERSYVRFWFLFCFHLFAINAYAYALTFRFFNFKSTFLSSWQQCSTKRDCVGIWIFSLASSDNKILWLIKLNELSTFYFAYCALKRQFEIVVCDHTYFLRCLVRQQPVRIRSTKNDYTFVFPIEAMHAGAYTQSLQQSAPCCTLSTTHTT